MQISEETGWANKKMDQDGKIKRSLGEGNTGQMEIHFRFPFTNIQGTQRGDGAPCADTELLYRWDNWDMWDSTFIWGSVMDGKTRQALSFFLCEVQMHGARLWNR